MTRLYDISRTISPALAVWPGDTPFSFEQIMDMRRGDSVNLTTLTLSPHTGSHADAPWHTAPDGLHPAALSLEPYIGPVQVLVTNRRSGGIAPEEVIRWLAPGITRVLIHSWVSDLPDAAWPDDFPYPTVELVDALDALGVVLLGLDMPSVDDFESMDLPVHRRLRERGMVHLESLCLRGVPDGVYELIALPLKIDDVCGSPVRAVLRG